MQQSNEEGPAGGPSRAGLETTKGEGSVVSTLLGQSQSANDDGYDTGKSEEDGKCLCTVTSQQAFQKVREIDTYVQDRQPLVQEG